MIRPVPLACALGLLVAASAGPAIAQTTAPTTPPATAAATTARASTFVPTVAASNQFEIESSQLALDRSADGSIKRFAQRMVTDHNMAADKFEKALADAEIAMPPQKLDAKHQAILDQLEAASGDAFDKAYIEAQYNAHTEAVELFRAFVKDGDTPRLKAFAADVLPTLEGHLNHVKDLRR